jgi:hypothetical protein
VDVDGRPRCLGIGANPDDAPPDWDYHRSRALVACSFCLRFIVGISISSSTSLLSKNHSNINHHHHHRHHHHSQHVHRGRVKAQGRSNASALQAAAAKARETKAAAAAAAAAAPSSRAYQTFGGEAGGGGLQPGVVVAILSGMCVLMMVVVLRWCS